MKILLIAFILVTAGQHLSAQKTIDLFKSELPDRIVDNKSSYEQISTLFEYYSQLEPSLFGYYINYLKKKFSLSIANPDSNDYHLLAAETNKVIERRSLWLENEMEFNWKNSPSVIFGFKIDSFLDDLVFEKWKSPDTILIVSDIDSNFINYCTYKYFCADSNLVYDSNLDYKALFQPVIKNKCDILNNNFDSSKMLSASERSRLAESSESKFYLFNQAYGNTNYPKTRMRAGEYLYQMFVEDYTQKSLFGINLTYSVFVQKYKSDFSFNETLSDRESFKLHPTAIETKVENLLSLGFLYKHKLRESKRPYSFISVGIGVALNNNLLSVSSGIPDSAETFYVIRPDTGFYGYRVNTKYKFSKVNVSGIKNYSAQLNIPVYYAFRRLYLEIGLNYTFSTSKMNYTIERSDEFYIPNPLDPALLTNYKKEETVLFKKHYFYPTVSATYDLTEFLSIKGKFQIGDENLNIELMAHL